MLKRRWLVVLAWAGEWVVHDRAWTEWGATRKAVRLARRGPFPHVLAPVHHLAQGAGYCHEDEFDDLPSLGVDSNR